MAAGDVVQVGPTSTANNAFLTIRPGSSVEWVIHNIYCPGAAELSYYDGTNTITFGEIEAAGGWFGESFHLTNGTYLRVKNTSGSTDFFAADGLQTK